MSSLLTKITTGLFIFVFLFFGLKGCFVTIYSQEELRIFQNRSETGEVNTLYIVPTNFLIFRKEYEEQYEYGVFYVRASNATQYVGPIYKTGESFLGIGIHKGAKEVWNAEMELTEKSGNLKETTFREVGEKFRQLIVFKDNSIELDNINYKEIKVSKKDQDFVSFVIKPHR